MYLLFHFCTYFHVDIPAEPMDTSRSPESPLERFVISAVINDSTSLFSADEEQFELATPVGELKALYIISHTA